MIAQKEFTDFIGPRIERFLYDNGTSFRMTHDGGAAMADDDANGHYEAQADLLEFADGSSAMLTWGMVNFTETEFERFSPMGQSGSAYARLSVYDEARRDLGTMMVQVQYLARECRGWTVVIREPIPIVVRHVGKSPARRKLQELVSRLELFGRNERVVLPEQAGRLAYAMAAFIAQGPF